MRLIERENAPSAQMRSRGGACTNGDTRNERVSKTTFAFVFFFWTRKARPNFLPGSKDRQRKLSGSPGGGVIPIPPRHWNRVTCGFLLLGAGHSSDRPEDSIGAPGVLYQTGTSACAGCALKTDAAPSNQDEKYTIPPTGTNKNP